MGSDLFRPGSPPLESPALLGQGLGKARGAAAALRREPRADSDGLFATSIDPFTDGQAIAGAAASGVHTLSEAPEIGAEFLDKQR